MSLWAQGTWEAPTGLPLAPGFGCSQNTAPRSGIITCALMAIKQRGEITAIFSCEQPGFLKMHVPDYYIFPDPPRPLPSRKTKVLAGKGIVFGTSAPTQLLQKLGDSRDAREHQRCQGWFQVFA